jgi:hypothetical protein
MEAMRRVPELRPRMLDTFRGKPPMQAQVVDLAAQALGLPAEDRAKFVERMLENFEPRSPAQAAWLRIAATRREQVRTGAVAMVPGDDAVARVRARIS